MSLLTQSEFEEHFETDLSDIAIDRLIDDAEREIIVRFGAHLTQTDYRDGLERLLFLSRPASSITTVVETIAETDTTLSSDDYQLEVGGHQLRRLASGTNGRTYWGDRVKVTYVPEDDTARRKRVQLDLVKLALQYEGSKSTKIGNLAMDIGDYQKQRDSILSALARRLL